MMWANARRRSGLVARIAMASASVLLGTAGAAAAQDQAPGDTDLKELFRAVIANPSDAEANFQYAQRAEQLGERRKALAAYERVLAGDPDNREARAALERLKLQIAPEVTQWVASLGSQWETNTLGRDLDTDGSHDLTGAASLRVNHETTIGDNRYRFDGFAYANKHARHSESDLTYLSAKGGPLYVLPNGWIVQPAASVEVAGLSDDFLFVAGGVEANVETPGNAPLNGWSVSVSYAEYGPEFDDRDGVVGEVSANLSWEKLVAENDAFYLVPSYIYNGAEGGENRNRYHQVGTNGSYIVPLTKDMPGVRRLLGAVEMAVEGRAYVGREQNQEDNRRDIRMTPGARLIAQGVGIDAVTASLRYAYDRNVSNDADKSFENHLLGLTVSYGF